MITEKISVKTVLFSGREAHSVSNLGEYSLKDTLECGQCFRHEEICSSDGYCEYLIPVGTSLIKVGQRERGELLFFDTDEKELQSLIFPYFTLQRDYDAIRRDIISRTSSDWLKCAAHAAGGIAILKQDAWETLFSFIISQNNNIPRIRKIVREMASEYGVNISLQNNAKVCPCNKIDCAPCEEKCKKCGICYTFPTAAAVASAPELMQRSKPGFRYKYLLDAAEKVARGEVDLEKIEKVGEYEYTVAELSRIKGVGLKVASCTALFGFSNLEAFPIDVWMKRAIDEYFDGDLDPKTLGEYAGVAQQYIFHYIRNLQG